MNQKEIGKYMEELENRLKAESYDYNLRHFSKQTINYKELWLQLKSKLNNQKSSASDKEKKELKKT
jgi:hypothetical protein